MATDLLSRMADALREARYRFIYRGLIVAESDTIDRIDALLAEHDAQPERGEPVAGQREAVIFGEFNACMFKETCRANLLKLIEKEAAPQPERGEG